MTTNMIYYYWRDTIEFIEGKSNPRIPDTSRLMISRRQIYAAGDNSNMFRSLSLTVGAGIKAGAFINHELITGL